MNVTPKRKINVNNGHSNIKSTKMSHRNRSNYESSLSERTPTNASENNSIKFTLGVNLDDLVPTVDEDRVDINDESSLDENDITLNNSFSYLSSVNFNGPKIAYKQINDQADVNRLNLINSYSHSMPQLKKNPPNPSYHHQHNHHNYHYNFNHQNVFNLPGTLAPNQINIVGHCSLQPYNPSKLTPPTGLFNDLHLSSFHFHNTETFNIFLHYSLNLSPEVIKELTNDQKVQFWIDRNKPNGFIYQAYPKSFHFFFSILFLVHLLKEVVSNTFYFFLF